jgi:hypothetical protein
MTRLWPWSAGRRRAGRRGWQARSSTEPSRIRTRHRCQRIRQCRRLSVSDTISRRIILIHAGYLPYTHWLPRDSPCHPPLRYHRHSWSGESQH